MKRITRTLAASQLLTLKGSVYIMVQTQDGSDSMAIRTTKAEVRRAVKSKERDTKSKCRFEVISVTDETTTYHFINYLNS